MNWAWQNLRGADFSTCVQTAVPSECFVLLGYKKDKK